MLCQACHLYSDEWSQGKPYRWLDQRDAGDGRRLVGIPARCRFFTRFMELMLGDEQRPAAADPLMRHNLRSANAGDTWPTCQLACCWQAGRPRAAPAESRFQSEAARGCQVYRCDMTGRSSSASRREGRARTSRKRGYVRRQPAQFQIITPTPSAPPRRCPAQHKRTAGLSIGPPDRGPRRKETDSHSECRFRAQLARSFRS